MARNKQSTTESEESISESHLHYRLREGLLILTIAISIFLFISLITYHRTDPGWSHVAVTHHIANAAGRVGAWVADFFLSLCGYFAYLFPLMISYAAWLFYQYHYGERSAGFRVSMFVLRFVGFLLILLTVTGLASLHIRNIGLQLPFSSGGILGNVIGIGTLEVFNPTGSSVVLVALLLIGVTLFTGLSWFVLLENIGAGVLWFSQCVWDWCREMSWRDTFSRFNALGKKEALVFEAPADVTTSKSEKTSLVSKIAKMTKISGKTKAAKKEEPRFDAQISSSDVKNFKTPRYSKSNIMPKISLLDQPNHDKSAQLSSQEIEARSREVELRLRDFGVEGTVSAVHPGPVVTRFELELAAGTKVSKITGLAKDLARSLSVISVRVVEVIPGKSAIGIELPNANRETVLLQEVLASKQYRNAHSSLTLALGKDIAGHPVIVDLAKMPHLLVAGTTGSGKSVSLNAMLLSLLYKATPKDLRLILIDPKMLELAVYDDIPHLLAPVVTDMKDAARALRWCVVEMERRYRLMAALGVRNIAGYNAKIKQARERGTPIIDPLQTDGDAARALQELPKIVVLADEFADMMVVVGKKVETLIARLAQKARAAGVHLIFATQRPSVDVITGLIKANIPTRIAFQVSQKVDSRTILDQSGAEQLLGHGDMLYLAPGTGVPVRVHGAYVSDDEVHRVVQYLKQQGKPDYLEDLLDENLGTDTTGYVQAAMGENDAEQDPHYDEAVEMVTKSRRVSVSSIQRRFKIGYNRAARVVEAMEVAGVVSKMENNGNREVLAPPPRD